MSVDAMLDGEATAGAQTARWCVLCGASVAAGAVAGTVVWWVAVARFTGIPITIRLRRRRTP